MSQIGFSQARTGRRASTGGNFSGISQMTFTPGKRNRLILPLRQDEDGNAQIVLFGETIHRLNAPSTIQLPKRKGGHYSPYTFRCTHPYSQQSYDKSVKLAERKEMCVLCEYERLHNQRRMGLMEEEYGSFEEFKKLDNKDKKAFFQRHEIPVERSYFDKEDADGETYRAQTTEMYLLAMEIETEEKIKKVKVKSTGKIREIPETVPAVDDEGNIKYKPVFHRVSGKRLDDFKDAVDNGIQAGTLSFESLTPYIENEGTDFEEEVNIGWVDFEMAYPDKDRMESARDVKISAMPESKSVLISNPEIQEQIEEKMDEHYKNATETFSKLFKHLKGYKRDEIMSLLSPDAKAEFLQLREEFRTEEDEEFEQGIYDSILNREGSTDEDSKEQADNKEESSSKEEKETKKSKTTKETKKEETKKEETKKEETKEEETTEDELDDTDEFDEDELFDEV